MRSEVHKQAAEEYLKIAEEIDSRFSKEKEATKKTSLMVVAARNYFYSAVNSIEAVFARKLERIHSAMRTG